MTAALEVEGLRVEIDTRRGRVAALDDVTLSIGRGEVLGVVGESGAGKSLTGTAILSLLEPPLHLVAGYITLAGQRIDNLPEPALRKLRGRQIGAVFQDPLTSLNPLLTIGHQVVQTITTHLSVTAAAARQRAEQLLAEVGLPAPHEHMTRYPHQLSGGMRQRVVLALAFACEPALIIADEPTTALDVSVQAQVILLLQRMCRERDAAVMLITHDMGVIAQVADRVAVMYAGRVVETGLTAQVLAAPAHPYSRDLMDCIPSMYRQTDELSQIGGSMPRPGEIPAGCSFHPRCTQRLPRCATDRPATYYHAGGTLAACWLAAPAC